MIEQANVKKDSPRAADALVDAQEYEYAPGKSENRGDLIEE